MTHSPENVRLLLSEDEPEYKRSILNIIIQAGFQSNNILIADDTPSTRNYINWLKKGEIDAFLLDQHLPPDLSPEEAQKTIQLIRKRHPQAPIIGTSTVFFSGVDTNVRKDSQDLQWLSIYILRELDSRR
jgi:hypothetical protein